MQTLIVKFQFIFIFYIEANKHALFANRLMKAYQII